MSGTSVDSRLPIVDDEITPIQCITVHKAKGLEYGHVLVPYASASIDSMKNANLHISTQKIGGRTKVGYSIRYLDANERINNEYFNENIERSERAREETRILYVAMTRAMRSFSWISVEGSKTLSWQMLIRGES